MSARKKSAPQSARRAVDLQNEFVRKREKEFRHQQTWDGQVKYYEHWEKQNNIYENWASPRYHETHAKTVENFMKKREKEDRLEKRREKLRKLFAEEEKSYQIELMVRNRDKYLSPRPKTEAVPTDVLKEVNLGIQQFEEDRKKHEAEIKLYQRWRENNPIVRDHDRLRYNKDLKLSWLDQQIQKQIEKEKAEEECRQMLKEREKLIKEEKAREEQLKKEIEEKNLILQEELKKQVEELHKKQEEADELRKQEYEEMQIRMQLLELEEKQKAEEKRRTDREVALYNIRQYKLRLKQKARMIEENLENEKRLIQELLDSQIAEKLESEARKREIKEAIDQFLKYTREQQELEKHRQQYLDFVFDSEAKQMYEKQQQIWSTEEEARKQLLKDVMASVKSQIEAKIDEKKEKQKRILEEREQMLKSIEEYDEKIKALKEEAELKRAEWKRELDEQIKDKIARRREKKVLEQRRIDDELEAARKEEERLRREILEIQKRPFAKPPRRSRIFF